MQNKKAPECSCSWFLICSTNDIECSHEAVYFVSITERGNDWGNIQVKEGAACCLTLTSIARRYPRSNIKSLTTRLPYYYTTYYWGTTVLQPDKNLPLYNLLLRQLLA